MYILLVGVLLPPVSLDRDDLYARARIMCAAGVQKFAL